MNIFSVLTLFLPVSGSPINVFGLACLWSELLIRIKAKYSPDLPVFQAKICFVRSVFSLWTTFSYWGSDPATTLLSKGAGWLAGVTYPKLLDLFSSDTCCKWPWLCCLNLNMTWTGYVIVLMPIILCADCWSSRDKKKVLRISCLINGDLMLLGYL